MATRLAILATAQAIRRLLAAASANTEFAGAAFTLVQPADLSAAAPPVAEGLTVCLYQITPNTAQQNTPPRPDPAGRRAGPPLPLDLHFLLTPWSASAVTQLRLLGWALRALDDTPVLTANLLNADFPGQPVFQPDETVEVVFDPVPLQDLARLCESLHQPRAMSSLTYLARPVSIESTAAPGA